MSEQNYMASCLIVVVIAIPRATQVRGKKNCVDIAVSFWLKEIKS